MSGVCPVPFEKTATSFNDVSTISAEVPITQQSASCSNGTETNVTGNNGVPTIVTEITPVPGPAGPIGPTGLDGLDGLDGAGWLNVGAWTLNVPYVTQNFPSIDNGDEVTHNTTIYRCLVDHTAASINEPGVGADWLTVWVSYGSTTPGTMIWTGEWTPVSYSYKVDDVVRNNFRMYICALSHTSDANNEPFFENDETTWIEAPTLDSASIQNVELPPENQSFFDNLKDGLFDHLASLPNWTVEDWVGTIAAGAGLYIAGNVLVDVFTSDGTGDGSADQKYTGTDSYIGVFIPPTLPSVVTKICTALGLTNIDVSELPSTIQVRATIDLRNRGQLLVDLSRAFQFDIVRTFDINGRKLKFKLRSADSVVTLTDKDIGWSADDTPQSPYAAKRIQDLELPKLVRVNYSSEQLDYNNFTQESELSLFNDGLDVEIDLKQLTIEDNQAKEISESILIQSHLERTTYSFNVNFDFIHLEPGDIITMATVSLNTNVRIVSISEDGDSPGLLNLVAVEAGIPKAPEPIMSGANIIGYTASTYLGTGLAVQPPTTNTQLPTSIGYSSVLFLDMPSLNSSDDQPRLYAAVHGYGAVGWPGCVLYKSTDGGNSFKSETSVFVESNWGKTFNSTMSPYPTWYTTIQEGLILTIQMKTGSLTSAPSEQAFLDGARTLMVGRELIYYRTATLIATNTYEINGFLRGRRGTDPFIDNHVADEAVIVVDENLISIPMLLSDQNVPLKFKSVTSGSSLSQTTEIDVTPKLESLKPWTVVNVTAVQTVNDWIISWTGRPRFDGNADAGKTPVNDPDFGGFNIAIINPIGDVVVRQQQNMAVGFTYTAAQQITDFGSVQPSIKFSIVSISTKTGMGHPLVSIF